MPSRRLRLPSLLISRATMTKMMTRMLKRTKSPRYDRLSLQVQLILLRTNQLTLQAIKLVEEGKKQAAEANAEQPVDPELQKLASLIPGVSAAVGSTPNKKEKSKKR